MKLETHGTTFSFTETSFHAIWRDGSISILLVIRAQIICVMGLSLTYYPDQVARVVRAMPFIIMFRAVHWPIPVADGELESK